MVRAALGPPRGQIGRGPSPFAGYVPAASVVIASLLACLPIISTSGWYPDFGYLVAKEVPGVNDMDYLQPKKMYERQGRQGEYNQLVAKYNTDRREYLRKWKGLSEEIVNAI